MFADAWFWLAIPSAEGPIRITAREADLVTASQDDLQTFHAERTACPPDPAIPYPRSRFLAINQTLAGRSASRRMKYGYHSVPNGI